MIDIVFFKDLRRNAYVDAVTLKLTKNNVLGYFAKDIDEAFLMSYGLVCYPIGSTDTEILAYGDYVTCDMISATTIYMTTKKCPLIYSSKMFIIEKICKRFTEVFTSNCDRLVYEFSGDIAASDIDSVIKSVYGFKFDEKKYKENKKTFSKIDELLEIIKEKIEPYEYNIVKYYIRYVHDLEKRVKILEKVLEDNINGINKNKDKCINVACPEIILDEIKGPICESYKGIDLAPKGCILKGGQNG